MKLWIVVLFSACTLTDAWCVSLAFSRTQYRASRAFTPQMSLDYNDPAVSEEFNKVQPMTYEEVEEELRQSGIHAPPTMNEMEVKLMLVEARLRLEGKLDSDGAQEQPPTKFSSKFEEAMWTKPVFEEFYNSLKAKGDHNSMNVVAEYLNDPEVALTRYASSYKSLLQQCDKALTAPPPVKSATLEFHGFPANMGEAGCKMTLETVGSVAEFECSEDDDFPVLKGKITFDDIESARKAVETYHGMDMGMGTSLQLISV